MCRVILEAEQYPETEAEDWQAIGAEALCFRASGTQSKAAPNQPNGAEQKKQSQIA